MRVLLVSYWFPPAGGIAVQRALSLARYLPQHGCEVHVLAPSNPPSPVLDPSLLAQIPSDVQIHRAWTPMPPAQLRKRLWSLISGPRTEGPQSARKASNGPSLISTLTQRVFCPDPEVVWVPFAIRRARQVVKKYGIDAILVTAPPFSAFLVGNAIKRAFPAVRLISDFRDEWLRFFLSTFEFQNSPYIRRRSESIERATVELSDVVVSVTAPLVDELRNRYSGQPGGKFVCIPNGYDPAAFANFHRRAHEGSKVVITYVGTVYSATSPLCYFEALDALPESLRARIETRFIGRVAEDQRDLLESRRDIKLLGYVPQAEALRHMEETDYLLLTMTDPTCVTGKIYEYLATGKPILAFSPPGGEVARTIEETSGGWCIDPADGEAIRTCLKNIASGELAAQFRPDGEAIRRYERPRLAAEFAAILISGARATPAAPEAAVTPAR
jgi:glycosyltransferase involved in cell wall biosynthesis